MTTPDGNSTRPVTPHPTRQPTPHPAPRPAPPGAAEGRELAEALRHLEEVDPQDLDEVISAAEQAHQQLRNRLGHAGGA